MIDSIAEKNTPAYKLFHEVFNVSIPNAFVRSDKDQQMYGYVSTGDATHDHQNAMMHVRVCRTVPVLAELYQMGVDVNVLTPEIQVPQMCKLITDHVESLLELYNSSQNQTFVEAEFDTPELRQDIETLEHFLAWLQDRPRDLLPKEESQGTIGTYLKRFMVLGKSRHDVPVPLIPAEKAKSSFRSNLTASGKARLKRW